MNTPKPLINATTSTDWWFIFKFNSADFPGTGNDQPRTCPFGGSVQSYKESFSQQYVYASANNPELEKGEGALGASEQDPLSHTFDQIYNGDCYYLIWNDQFYGDPEYKNHSKNTKDLGAPWGHSKGLLAWDEEGNGLMLQVSTPSWPASGSAKHPRQSDGNTLGCVKDDDVEVSQHFFCTAVNAQDIKSILGALQNASIATNPDDKQVCNNGGPEDIQNLVAQLSELSKSTTVFQSKLSNGMTLIGKPSRLHVPTWQMVSAQLNGLDLRVASWWSHPELPSTNQDTKITAWDNSLGQPGAVQIATTGQWADTTLGLEGGGGHNKNHAKFGVSQNTDQPLCIFGDMNQQGSLDEAHADTSQNGRGGLFFVVDNQTLWQSVSNLLKGDSAPLAGS